MPELTQSECLGKFEIRIPAVGLNKLIRMFEWQRNQELGKWRSEVGYRSILGEFAIPKDGPWPIRVRYTQLLGKRGRAFDDDNRAGMAKLIGDALVRLQLVPDDSHEYVRTEYGEAVKADDGVAGVRVEIFAGGGMCPHCGRAW